VRASGDGERIPRDESGHEGRNYRHGLGAGNQHRIPCPERGFEFSKEIKTFEVNRNFYIEAAKSDL
jgi:hypothetical protein